MISHLNIRFANFSICSSAPLNFASLDRRNGWQCVAMPRLVSFCFPPLFWRSSTKTQIPRYIWWDRRSHHASIQHFRIYLSFWQWFYGYCFRCLDNWYKITASRVSIVIYDSRTRKTKLCTSVHCGNEMTNDWVVMGTQRQYLGWPAMCYTPTAEGLRWVCMFVCVCEMCVTKYGEWKMTVNYMVVSVVSDWIYRNGHKSGNTSMVNTTVQRSINIVARLLYVEAVYMGNMLMHIDRFTAPTDK